MLRHAHVLTYDPKIFACLSEFQKAKIDAKIESIKIIELGNIICRYKLHNKIGLSLLHKHFNIKSNQILIRNIDNNIALTFPHNNENIEVVSYMWKINQNKDNCYCIYPLEFMQLKTNSKMATRIMKISSNVTSNLSFLKDFSAKLIDLQLNDVFGISILNSCFLSKRKDETFLETTNAKYKRLVLKPKRRREITEEMTQTQWIFSPSADIETACTHCSHGDCGHCFHS